MTTYADDASVLGALRAGARGYLTKDAGAEQIRAAVEAVARGEAALDPAVQHHVLAALTEPAAAELPDGLTPREAEVLALIAEGLTNTEIAERLVVSAATVKTHVNHIFAKAGRARPRAGRGVRLRERARLGLELGRGGEPALDVGERRLGRAVVVDQRLLVDRR